MLETIPYRKRMKATAKEAPKHGEEDTDLKKIVSKILTMIDEIDLLFVK